MVEWAAEDCHLFRAYMRWASDKCGRLGDWAVDDAWLAGGSQAARAREEEEEGDCHWGMDGRLRQKCSSE